MLAEAALALGWPAPGAALSAADLLVAVALALPVGAIGGLLAAIVARRGPPCLGLVPLAVIAAPQLLRPFALPYAWDPVLSGFIVLLAVSLPRVASAVAAAVIFAVPVAAALALDRGAGPVPAVGAGVPGRPDILLVTVDTLRADAHLTLPAALRWRVYDQAVSGGPWTLPAMDSLFTGAPVVRHRGGLPIGDLRRYSLVSADLGWLPEALHARGYRTRAFVSNPWLGRTHRFDRGFDVFVHADAFREPFLLRRGFERLRHRLTGRVERLRRERDARVVAEATRVLAGRQTAPLFAWVHLLAPHEYARAPARPVAGWTPGSEDPAILRAAYGANVAAVGEHLAALAGAVDPARTVVAVTADHGEQLGERGVFGHGLALCDEELRVPLALAGPGVEPGREPGQVSTFALADALLAVADGAAVVPDLPARERAPVAGLRRAAGAAERLAGAPGVYLAGQDPLDPGAAAPALDREVREALRGMGYLE